MGIKETITGLKEHYTLIIKPLLEQKQYVMAGMDLWCVNNTEINPNQAEIKKYHSGPSLVASANMLEKLLSRGEPGGEVQMLFEASLAQVGMSIETGNAFKRD